MDAFVGLERMQGEDGMDSYIQQLIEYFELAMGEPLRKKQTPMLNAPGIGVLAPFVSAAEQMACQSWVQRLAYPAVWTRQDLSFTVGSLALHGGKPGKAGPSHCHVTGYLEKHQSLQLHYNAAELVILSQDT